MSTITPNNDWITGNLFRTQINTNFSNLNTDKLESTDLKTVNWNSLVWSGDIVISGGGSVATDAIWDSKWDLAGWTGANTASRLAVGTNWQVLTADSAEATGLKWSNPAGGWDALTSWTLAQFAATTSLELKWVISDETGSGSIVFATSPTLVTPVLGTPTSWTLTNCTGLPLSGVVDSTSEALGVWTLELWHASDTTFAREAAGVYSVEGEIMNGFTSTATAAGTTTMTKASTKIQQFTGTTTQTILLPTTGIIKGQQYIVQNIGSAQGAMLTVQSSGANEIVKIGYGCTVVFTSTQATPTTAAHWTYQKFGTNVLTATSYTTDTGTSLNCDYWDVFVVTAQAGALKLNNPTGSPRDGQLLFVAVTWTAARAITYDTQFEASTVALPSTTVTTARLNLLFVWRADTSKWVLLSAV